MISYLQKGKKTLSYRIFAGFLSISFVLSMMVPPGYAQVKAPTVLNLSPPGMRLAPTPVFTPPLVQGITLYPHNPLEFSFIIRQGVEKVEGNPFMSEAQKMVKYFLASLTIPEDELWRSEE